MSSALVEMISSRRKSSKASFEKSLARRAAIEALEARRLLTAWYVATTGVPTNNGSLNQPFATIQAAANVAGPGDTVYIMGGVYHETVTPPTGGTPGAPITFEPYHGQSVTIDGADPVTGWSLYQGATYSSPLSWDLGEGNNQVFVDGTMVNEARWPNTPADVAATSSTSIAPANISTPTWATATKVSAGAINASTGLTTITISNASLSQTAGTWVGSIAHIAAGQEWLDQAGLITASSPGSITVSYYQETSYQVPKAGNRFYIVGNFKALDSAGEWYRDPVSGNLYLWDPSGDSPANHSIEAKARDYGFDLSGLSDIDVTGIDLFACTINTDANSSNNVLNGISAQYVSQSIGITPDTLDPWGAKLHPHTTGIILDGTANVLENSTVAFSSGDGVFLGGSGNTVENTVIHDVDYEAGDEAGISSIGSGETILNNTIYNAGRSGIVSRYTCDSLISHNVVHTVGLQTTDLGGIYTWGTDADGTEISYNVVYGIHTAGYGASGIYMDNGSQDFIVDHNLVFDCDFALKLNPPSWDNLIVNNTFVGTQYALESSGNEDMTGSALTGNIFVGATMIGSGAIQTNNVAGTTNPAFVNAAQENYQLSASSAAINAGIAELPYTANYTGSAPDSGAYEYGAVPFAAGAAGQPFIPPTPPGSTSVSWPPATPAIIWAAPSSIPLGVALGAGQLDATAPPIPGAFVYTPSLGTVLAAGDDQTLSVTFTPFDTVDYASATASVTIKVIAPAPSVISWPNPSAIVYGTALDSAQLNAAASIPGVFVYSPAAGTILGAGAAQNVSVTFTPTDTIDYAVATASITIDILPATPTLRWAPSSAIIYGTALGAAQLDATSSVPGAFAYTPAAGTVLDPGNGQMLSAIFTPADAVDYTGAAASATIDVILRPATPAIVWTDPSPITYGAVLSMTQLNATSPVSGTFVYTPAAGAVLGVGDNQLLSVAFTPTDTADYTGATASALIDVITAPTSTVVTSSNASPNAGQTVTLTATVTPATGAGETGTVQFQIDGNIAGSPIALNGGVGAYTTSSLTPGSHSVVAIYGGDHDFAASASAAFNENVKNAPPPTVIAIPSNQTAIAGQYATFTASGTGNPTPTVQWQVSADGGSTWANVPGATAPAYTFKPTTPQSGYRYRAVFTNSNGASISGSAILTVLFAPVITKQPASASVNVGAAVTFTAAANGNPAPAVQWQLSIDGGTTWAPISGATAATYSLPATLAVNGYKYRAVFTNAKGAATTNAATLKVAALVAPAVTKQPASQSIVHGHSVTFTVAASGNPAPTIQWQLSADGGSTWADIGGATSASYTFTTTTAESGRKYRVIFTNSAGTAISGAATLTVK
ncbi:MAG TPA: Ig-like domain repeat protein [Tepidisphaeraceae bacterium]|jgi:hypothetical protein|nr:Ig-like domain repeat protein [Tepidisphaeraceae bacterium]